MDGILAPEPPESVERGPRPRFSLLIAAYQAADTIADAIDSALSQTEPPFEIVVCNDGSTDGTEEALAPYRDRITYLRQENAGEGAAKNAAARASSGDFVVFLDADDAFLPGRLQALGDLAELRPDLDVLATDAYLELDGRILRTAYDDDWKFEPVEQRQAILERCFVDGKSAIRRTCFFEIDGFDETIRWATDWDLWIRLILRGARAGLIPEPLARYRLREGSLSTNQLELARGEVRVLEKAASRPELSADERTTAADALAKRRRLADLEEARAALLDGNRAARRWCLTVARDSGQPPRARVKTGLAVLAPWAVRVVLARRERTRWIAGGGEWVERERV